MTEVICNTSPLQYLHQTRLLHLLPDLYHSITVPTAVVDELAVGRSKGVDLPDPAGHAWLQVRAPTSAAALPLVADLGRGEAEVLASALELPGSLAVLDDGPARRICDGLGLRLIGTVGILLEAKSAGRLPAVRPVLDELQQLRFRRSARTRETALRAAGE